MSTDRQDTLPYRVDASDLHRFITARAHGRSAAQIRSLGFAPKTFEGTLSSVESLGLIDNKSGELTVLGRRYAVSTDAEMEGVLRRMVWRFPPYSLLLDAVLLGSGPDPTPLEWIETWWATHGYGSSESNRAEAAPVFAKLVDAAGLGSFIPGRRGHVSRIEWAPNAAALLREVRDDSSAAASAPVSERTAVRPPSSPHESERRESRSAASAAQHSFAPAGMHAENSLTWHLSPGRFVQVRMPSELNPSEKLRLLQLFELLLRD